MSYKLALWAFHGAVDSKRIVAAFIDAIEVVEWDVPIDVGFITLQEIDGMKFAYLRAKGRQPGISVLRGTFQDGLDEIPSAFLGHDDQNGVSIFDSTVDDGLYLMSDSYLLGGDLEKIAIEYPQRGLSDDQLDELYGRTDDDDQGSDPADHASAIEIGMRQVFGWEGSYYVDVCRETRGYDHRTGQLTEVPDDALPLVAFWAQDSDWRRSKLKPRLY